MPDFRSTIVLLTCLSNLTITSHAWGKLGEATEAVEQDVANFGMDSVEKSSTTKGLYHVETRKSPYMTIEEYSYNNLVVAVVREGVTHPDLVQLLGKDFAADIAEVSKVKKKSRGQRTGTLLEGKRVVVRKGGHARWHVTVACAPEHLPPGGSCNDF